jgi:hypothetical protein
MFLLLSKVITSLGLKDAPANWTNIPEDFILYFEYIAKYEDLTF